MHRLRSGVLAGSLLGIGALAFATLQLGATEVFSFDAPWVIGLGIHGVAFVALAVGFTLAGRLQGAGSRFRIAWSIGAFLLVIGSVTGWLVFTAGAFILGVVEAWRRRLLSGTTLTTGAVLLTIVYLRGAHVGDENSRLPVGMELPLFVVGLCLLTAGLLILGLRLVRESSRAE